jgi:hypothetical protein
MLPPVIEKEGFRAALSFIVAVRPLQPNPQAYDTALQDALVDACERLSGVKLPA